MAVAYRWTSPFMSQIEEDMAKKESEEKERWENEVKGCPFCGMKPDIRKPGFMWAIGCPTVNCFCNIGMNPLFKTKKEAIESWNRRLGEEGALRAIGTNLTEERR